VALLNPILGPINLEVGSGFGRMIPAYDNADVEYIGIEIDKRAAEFTKKHFRKEILVADMRYLPFRNQVFDSVLSVGAVEHVPETELSLYEHLRVTKQKGKCMVLIPSLYSPFIAFPTIRGMKRRYNGRDWQIHFGSRYTMKQIKQMLTKIHASIILAQHLGISLPGRAELLLHRLDKHIGNAYVVIFERAS
jgi:SAM-dependent methyltransferase